MLVSTLPLTHAVRLTRDNMHDLLSDEQREIVDDLDQFSRKRFEKQLQRLNIDSQDVAQMRIHHSGMFLLLDILGPSAAAEFARPARDVPPWHTEFPADNSNVVDDHNMAVDQHVRRKQRDTSKILPSDVQLRDDGNLFGLHLPLESARG